MRIFGFLIIVVSLLIVVLSAFFGLPLPIALKGLLDSGSLICVMGLVLGGCLIAYGSDTYKGCGAILKSTPSREEAEIAVSVHKLAVRISIGASFIGVMFGVIAMLGAMGAGSGGISVRWHSSFVDYDSIRGGIRLLFVSALAILLPTPVGQGLLTFGGAGDVQDRQGQKGLEGQHTESISHKHGSQSLQNRARPHLG